MTRYSKKRSGKGRNLVFPVFAAVLVLAFTQAGPALAEGQEPVRIGIMPVTTVKALVEKYQPLMEHLSKKVGRPFELRPMRSYDQIIEGLRSGEIDGGVLGSFTAQKAILAISAVPVARPEREGISSYRGYVVVRKDSGFRNIEDLKGKSFDCVSVGTSAGYYFPMSLLKERKGVPETFFSRLSFAGKHEGALAKVLNRESDGAAVKDTVFEKLAKSDPRVNEELAVIHKSEGFPDATLLFRRQAPPLLVGSVRQVLLGMEGDSEGKAVLAHLAVDRYIPTDKKEFAYLAKLVRIVNGK